MHRPLRLLLLLCLFSVSVQAAEPEVDLRVLIDVSGSMKKNDPANLRAPALRLLVGLLPEQSRAGVWSFGEYINELVPLGRVNESWKKQGQQASRRIGSREMFTNIEQGLIRATQDWKKAAQGTRRNVILLTDGLVDVGKDSALNVESRRRILEEILPALRETGTAVHTVALSENADHELLQTLAMATDGGYEYADSAERLNRVFVKLFEKSAPADSVPIKGNRFVIDGSIQDMTLLVFREDGARETSIITPDNQVISRKKLLPNVRWAHEQGYDLITVDGPAGGEWGLEAEVDPDNRVMVVTNLKMRTETLPNNLIKGDRLQVAAWLEENGEQVQQQDFLQLVSFEISEDTQAEPTTHSLADDGELADSAAGDGIYSADLGDLGSTGSFSYVLTARGGSFQREVRHSVQVHASPVKVLLEPVSDDPAAGFSLQVQVRKELADLASVLVEAQISGTESDGPGIPETGEAQWGLEIPAAADNRSAQVRVEGRLMNGRLFKVDIERLLPGIAEPKAPEAPVVVIPPQPAPEKVNWIKVGILVGGTNLVLIPLLVFGGVLWKKKRNAVLAAEHAALEL